MTALIGILNVSDSGALVLYRPHYKHLLLSDAQQKQ